MNSTIKKITSLFFILLGFIPVLLVLSFDLKQEVIRERMKLKLQHQHLQTILVPANAVSWMNDHEIWIGSRLFDVHDFTAANETYTFTGLFDDEETGLLHQKEENDQTGNEEISLLENLLDWIQAPYHTGDEEIMFLPNDPANFSLHNALSIINLIRKVPTPPPQRSLHLSV